MPEASPAIPKAGDVARGTCRAPECRAEILWARTTTGAMIPLDPEPEKRMVLVAQPGDLFIRAVGLVKLHRDADLTPGVVAPVDTYMPHHATCPGAARFRDAHLKAKINEVPE